MADVTLRANGTEVEMVITSGKIVFTERPGMQCEVVLSFDDTLELASRLIRVARDGRSRVKEVGE